MSNHTEFSRAVEAAERERDEIIDTLRNYEKLSQRIKVLESFINTGKALLGEDQETTTTTTFVKTTSFIPSTSTTTTTEPPQVVEKPLLEGIVEILKLTNKKMSLRELEEAFRIRNWKLSPKNGREVLRATVNSKKDLFVKHVDGNMVLYTLSEEPKPLFDESKEIHRRPIPTDNRME